MDLSAVTVTGPEGRVTAEDVRRAAAAGIVVPVLPDAPRLGRLEIARRLQDLAERARGGSLPADAFRDRSIALSNLGGLFLPPAPWLTGK